jgi:hypothetical protein
MESGREPKGREKRKRVGMKSKIYNYMGKGETYTIHMEGRIRRRR